MHKPSHQHWKAAERVLRYLKATNHLCLLIRPVALLSLITYSDSDWSENPDEQCSTSAYVTLLGGYPISWMSKKQRIVARFSTEAE